MKSLVPGLDYVTATRRNHALEHATVTVLLERHGFNQSLAGRSNDRGFTIMGNVPMEELESAVSEALTRMKHGESTLAVSPFCGTNIAVTGILAGLATLAVVGRQKRMQQLPNVLLGGMVAALVGQPVGRLAQKYLTTSPDMSTMKIVSISPSGWGPFKSHWVETRQY